MQKCENDVKKLIRKVTLKMIEKENDFFFFTKKMRFQSNDAPYSAIFYSKIGKYIFIKEKEEENNFFF